MQVHNGRYITDRQYYSEFYILNIRLDKYLPKQAVKAEVIREIFIIMIISKFLQFSRQ